MTFLSRLADRLVLQPTTDFVDPNGQEKRIVATSERRVEVWSGRTAPRSTDPTRVVVLKFPGTGGRAERGDPTAPQWKYRDLELPRQREQNQTD